MKRLWLCLISVLLLVSCSDEIPESPTPQVEGRTLLAYIVSNNSPYADLDKYLKANVVDMYKGLSASHDSIALLVYYRPKYDDSSLETPSILKYVADGKGNINGRKAIPASQLEINNSADMLALASSRVIDEAEIHPCQDKNQNATDPIVMTAVLQDMIKLVPSRSYGLTMGSHGTGWLPGNPIKGRSFGDDGGFNINIPELAKVLSTAFTGQKLDYVLFDACMMANAEVAYELRETTSHIIASVLETAVDGFPYSRIMPLLYSNSVNYQQICDEFIAFNIENAKDITNIGHNGREITPWGTCAVFDCSKMDALADWVKKNLAANKDKLTPDFYKQVRQYGSWSFRNYSFDVVDVFTQLKGEVPADLLSLMNSVIIAKSCIESDGTEFPNVVIDKQHFSGMGMYLPFNIGRTDWDTYYTNSLAWSKAVGWNEYRPQ